VRDSGHAPNSIAVAPDDVAGTVSAVVDALPAEGTTAILCPPGILEDVRPIATESVSVTTVANVKGLEFDTVIVAEPDAILDESPRGPADLYVALTRATQRLTVVHSRALPTALAGLQPRTAPPASGDVPQSSAGVGR